MKAIQDLTRDELISFIYNNTEFDTFEDSCECAVCGTNTNSLFYYVCDVCEELCNRD